MSRFHHGSVVTAATPSRSSTTVSPSARSVSKAAVSDGLSSDPVSTRPPSA